YPGKSIAGRHRRGAGGKPFAPGRRLEMGALLLAFAAPFAAVCRSCDIFLTCDAANTRLCHCRMEARDEAIRSCRNSCRCRGCPDRGGADPGARDRRCRGAGAKFAAKSAARPVAAAQAAAGTLAPVERASCRPGSGEIADVIVAAICG